MYCRISLLLTPIFLLSSLFSTGQDIFMLGYVDMCEACVWVKTDKSTEVVVDYWKKEEPSKKMTFTATSQVADHCVVHAVLGNLQPATTYLYSIKAGGKSISETEDFTTQVLWQYRTDPPNFRVAFGSCTYINEPEFDRPGPAYGGGYGIFDVIASKDPQLMLWLGDNIYLREGDYTPQRIIRRYELMRKTPEIQKLLHACPNYAIWDDHDYGPNDSNGSYIHKDWTLDAFKTFWANPSYGLPGQAEPTGITSQFSWGDIDFFMLDNRYNRVAADVQGAAEPTVLGEEQVDWLIQALKNSASPFKIICMGGQFLNSDMSFENYANWPKERQRILDAIEMNKVKGVVFLTGDRHCGEMSELKLKDGSMIYEFTASPLTSTAYDITKEPNALRVDGTIIPERNFATLDFSGVKGKRVMTVSAYNAAGELKWQKKMEQPSK